MRIIKRTFANLPGSILLIGRAGENNVTKLELDVSKEQSEFKNASFELVLKTPASEDPYPVVVEVTNNKLTYNFSGSDLAESGYGQLEALVVGSEGELLKSATAKIKINPSIISNTYPGPLQKVIEDLKEAIGELEAHDIKTVTELPDNPDDDEIVYLNAENSGFYRWDGSEWVRLTDDGEGLEALAKIVSDMGSQIDKIAVVEKYSDLSDSEDSEYDDAFVAFVYGFDGTTDKRGVYVKTNGEWIDPYRTEDSDDVTLLELNKTYSNLVIRDEVINTDGIQDVPVYTGSTEEICSLTDGTNYIALYETRNEESDITFGMPVRYIAVRMNGVSYYYIGSPWKQADGTIVPAGWDGEAPTITNFTPTDFVVMNMDGIRVVYSAISNMPDDAKSLLRSLSQCINVDAASMGTIRVPEDAVERFAGTIKTNHKYYFNAVEGSEIEFTLPTVTFSETDSQFVIYLKCDNYVDLTFPSTVSFVGDEPNSDEGNHKLIGCWLKDKGAWAIGGIDYTEQEVEST